MRKYYVVYDMEEKAYVKLNFLADPSATENVMEAEHFYSKNDAEQFIINNGCGIFTIIKIYK